MQKTPPPVEAPPPPLPPIPPTPPAPVVVPTPTPTGLVPGMPLSEAQREALLERRDELSTQLISASNRRAELADALEDAEGASRPGLEARINQLDQRILQLEADIAENGRLLAEAPLAGQFTTVEPGYFPGEGGPSFNGTPIGIVFTLFVLAPLALAYARLLWRRATSPAPAPVSLETVQRLERVEQAIDAVAVEVERVSEGQRFVTRILTEGPGLSALNAGRNAETIGAPRREAARIPLQEP